MLELQRNASHCRETSGRNESYLIVAVVVGMAAALAQCAVNPSALSVTLVEDIVQMSAEHHLFKSEELAVNIQGVCYVGIHHLIRRQRAVFVLRVVEIHAAHIL